MLTLLRPGLFPELLCEPHLLSPPSLYQGVYEDEDGLDGKDAGTVAVLSGHLHLLPWLLRHGCPIARHCVLNQGAMLRAAAEQFDLEGLQQVWELLGGIAGLQGDYYDLVEKFAKVAETAGTSGGTAVPKLLWLLSAVGESEEMLEECRDQLLVWAAAGAAASCSLPVLRWLLDRGLDLRTVIEDPLCKAHMVAPGLWCSLPRWSTGTLQWLTGWWTRRAAPCRRRSSSKCSRNSRRQRTWRRRTLGRRGLQACGRAQRGAAAWRPCAGCCGAG